MTALGFPAIAPHEVAPEIAAVLLPGERVIWQGAPAPRLSPVPILPLVVIGAGLAMAAGLFELPADFEGGLVPGLMLTGIGGVIFAGEWITARARWHYVLTDRRILSIRNGRILQEATPETLGPVRTVGLGGHGDVLWQPLGARVSGRRNRREGFTRQPDPKALAQLIESWRAQADEVAAQSGRAFGVARATGAMRAAETGAVRVENRRHGFRMDVPAGWEPKVSERYDGPLRVFGVTLLPRIIRDGKPVPHAMAPAEWNTLTVRGGPTAGLNVMVRPDAALPTLEGVMNDPWASVLGVKPQNVETDLDIGGFRGFAVTRALPGGAQLTGFGPVGVPVMAKQWWLNRDGLGLEMQGIAPGDSPDLQYAVDAIVGSLAPL